MFLGTIESIDGLVFHFRVEERFNGVKGNTIDINGLPSMDGSTGYEEGIKRYLVFAVRLSRGVIERAPSCPLGHYYLGKALFAMDATASETALRHCLGLSPDDTTAIDALTHIGSHMRAAGDVEGARMIWSDVVAKYRNNPHIKPVEAFFLQGSAQDALHLR